MKSTINSAKGKKVKLKPYHTDGRIKCNVSLSTYSDLPDAILVQSVFINISGKNYFIRDYTLIKSCFSLPLSDSVWWSFQVLHIVGVMILHFSSPNLSRRKIIWG